MPKTLAAITLATALACLAVAGNGDTKAALKKELQDLAGTWDVITAESNGMKSEDGQLQGFRYVFKADGTWQLRKDDQVQAEGTFKLDPSKKPRTIDYKIEKTIAEGTAGKSSLGIYELDGDTLRVCRTWPENEQRPAEFAAGAGSQLILSEMRRLKN